MKALARIWQAGCGLLLLAASAGLGLPAPPAEGGNPPRGNPAPLQPRTTTPARPNLVADNSLPAAPPGCANTVVTGKNTSAQAIPDDIPSGITSTINISTPNTYLWAVSVAVTITHPYPGDLKIRLIPPSPANSVIILSDRNGGNKSNVFNGTTFSDQAGLTNGSDLPITDYHFISATVASLLNPEEALSALRGQNPNGTWKLVVSDNAPADSGTLHSWSI